MPRKRGLGAAALGALLLGAGLASAAQGAASGAAPGAAPLPAMRPTGKAAQAPLPPRSFSIAVHPGPRLPADFAIGPLADLAAAAETEPAGLARAFLEALRAGKLELSRIAEDRRDLAASLARPLLEAKPPRGYRVGAALVAGEAASLGVRLEFEPEDSVGPRLRAWGGGELRLRAESGSWYIDDFSLDSRPPAGDEEAEAWEPPLPL